MDSTNPLWAIPSVDLVHQSSNFACHAPTLGLAPDILTAASLGPFFWNSSYEEYTLIVPSGILTRILGVFPSASTTRVSLSIR